MTICIIFSPNYTKFGQRNWPRIEDGWMSLMSYEYFDRYANANASFVHHCWINGQNETRTFFPFSSGFLLSGFAGLWGTCSCCPQIDTQILFVMMKNCSQEMQKRNEGKTQSGFRWFGWKPFNMTDNDISIKYAFAQLSSPRKLHPQQKQTNKPQWPRSHTT